MKPGALVRSPIPLGGEVAVLASAIGFGVGTSVSVLALRGLRPADLLAVELGGSAIVLLTVAAATGRLRRAGAGRGLVQGALTPGLSFLLGDLGLARTSATSGSLLLGTEMLLTVLLATVVLRERVDPRSAGALVLGLAGTALVSFGAAPSDTTGGSVAGNLLVLAAAACGAAFTVWSRHAKDENGEGLSLTTWQFLGAALAVSPFVLGAAGPPDHGPGRRCRGRRRLPRPRRRRPRRHRLHPGRRVARRHRGPTRRARPQGGGGRCPL
jgi:drug/metabolite transporter (DMT)-like permease